jgi:hypothetical protein
VTRTHLSNSYQIDDFLDTTMQTQPLSKFVTTQDNNYHVKSNSLGMHSTMHVFWYFRRYVGRLKIWEWVSPLAKKSCLNLMNTFGKKQMQLKYPRDKACKIRAFNHPYLPTRSIAYAWCTCTEKKSIAWSISSFSIHSGWYWS